MIKCIVCAERKYVEKAFTCSDCTHFMKANGFEFNGESIETYKAIVAGILARPENAEFLSVVMARKQKLQQSVLDAIASAMSKAGA